MKIEKKWKKLWRLDIIVINDFIVSLFFHAIDFFLMISLYQK